MITGYAGFIGQTYRSTSPRMAAEQALNMYPIPQQVAGARPPFPMVFAPTPGTRTFGTAGNGPIRDLFYEDGRCFCVSGTEYYEVAASGSTALRGTVAASGFPSRIATNGSGGGQNMIISGGLGYIHTLSTNAFAQITDIDFPANVVGLAFSDGYFLVASYATRQFNYSGRFNGITWGAADLAQKSQTTDNLRTLFVSHKEVWLPGSKTIEVWYNTGDLSVTFAPIQGVLIEHGVSAVESMRRLAGTIAWLGEDADGQAIAWYADGYTPVRFSHDGVERLWAAYDRVDDAYAWVHQYGGHTFYVLTFPTANATWVCDFTTRLWHERSFLNPASGEDEAHIGRCHAFAFGKHLVGSRNDGTIYELTPAALYDRDTDAIRRVRRAPHIFAGAGSRDITINEFAMRADVGVAATTGQGSDPRLMFRYSVDGGKTYSDEILLEQGVLGDYDRRVAVNRLGQGHDWVMEVATSEPITHAWGDAMIDAEGDGA